mmetsp:Transcript_28570/g.27540  ORF Transcript_28570/g.27540 Transcript_28570/m.27540 type:complete len:172 (+) Transcript_28570:339-854(+)
MGIVFSYSVFSNCFYIAFGPPTGDDYLGLQIFDGIIEFFFLFDIILHFITPYVDSANERHTKVSEIAQNYIFRGSFIFDLFALLPWRYFYPDKNQQLLLLPKMIRLYKLRVDFIPEDKIVSLVEMLIKAKDREQKIRIELLTTNIIKIFKQVIYTIIITYVLGCAWYFMSD